MPSKPLDPATIQALLKPKEKAAPKISEASRLRQRPIIREGPLVLYEKEKRCIVAGYYTYDEEGKVMWKKSGACGSPTHYELDGIPTCLAHAIDKLNYMVLEERGVDGATEKVGRDIPDLDKEGLERIYKEIFDPRADLNTIRTVLAELLRGISWEDRGDSN